MFLLLNKYINLCFTDNSIESEKYENNVGSSSNYGKDCWNECNKTLGPCSWCGPEGWCCSKEFKHYGCYGSFEVEKYHTCANCTCVDLVCKWKKILQNEQNALS